MSDLFWYCSYYLNHRKAFWFTGPPLLSAVIPFTQETQLWTNDPIPRHCGWLELPREDFNRDIASLHAKFVPKAEVHTTSRRSLPPCPELSQPSAYPELYLLLPKGFFLLRMGRPASSSCFQIKINICGAKMNKGINLQTVTFPSLGH